eukprot:scaffold121767_cov41-Tisochrysis_lutea.AAC.1
MAPPNAPTRTTLTMATPAHASQDQDSDEDNTITNSDATYDLSFHQAGDITLQDTTVSDALNRSCLSPDTMSKHIRA